VPLLKTSLLLSALLLMTTQSVLAGTKPTPSKQGFAIVYEIPNKTYQQAREDLDAAIEERGMVISAVSHIKDMLDRTNLDLGYSNQPVYATGGETVLFCKADLSQQMMRQNPHNIALCPYGISVYTLASHPTSVFLSYREPVNADFYKPIQQLLDDIIMSLAE
jgi:uncharacterized protein (DUF302 family)